MSIQLSIDYNQIIELVAQLTKAQQQDSVTRLLAERAKQRSLTAEEKIQLFDAAKIHHPVSEAPSPRREDKYGDDGR
jgi:hypothetical protein